MDDKFLMAKNAIIQCMKSWYVFNFNELFPYSLQIGAFENKL